MDFSLSEMTALVVSEHLINKGQVQKASDILVNLINQGKGSVEAFAALAHLAYSCRSWKPAADLWKAILKVQPDNLEANLKLTHCLLELGDSSADAQAAKLAEVVRRTESKTSDENDDLLKAVYEQVCLHLIGNQWQRGIRLIQACSLPKSYVARISSIPEVAAINQLTPVAISKRILEAVTNWEAGSRALPQLLDITDAVPPDISEIAGKKVLLVMRRFFLGKQDSREHELGVFFRASARQVGLNVTFFEAEPFLGPKFFTPDQQYRHLERFVQTVRSVRPDLIVFDDLCVTIPSEEYIGPEGLKRVLSQLKSEIGFKLIAYYPDAWTNESEAAIRFVSEFVDAVWHQNSNIPSSGNDRCRTFFAPVPYPEDLFYPATPKDIGAAFIGSVRDYNYPRGLWLTLIKAADVPCQVMLANHSVVGSPAGASAEEYAQFLARVKVTVNFSARTPTKKIMTGRTWEGVIARSVLLEEENHETSRFFVPFVHYMPFSNLQELDAYVRFFENDEQMRSAMSERAFQWYRTAVGKERIWATLFSKEIGRG